jgi:hypothetical protein
LECKLKVSISTHFISTSQTMNLKVETRRNVRQTWHDEGLGGECADEQLSGGRARDVSLTGEEIL